MAKNGSGASVVSGAALVLFLAAAPGPARADSFCGDGVLQPPEQCDDANTVSGDGCSFPSCLPELCGDGITNPDPPLDEACDDGNTLDDDGCTHPDCQFDCGDGELDAGATPPEVCDDGNRSNGDGCDDDPSADSPGNCTVTSCGNGVVTGIEFCDDGNTVSGDGCEADCANRDGFVTRPQQACVHAFNQNLAGVARAQADEVARCVQDAAAGKLADVVTCLVAGPKTTKAGERTVRTATGRKCTRDRLPDFAFTDATTANDAGSDRVLEGATFLLGAAPAIAPRTTDRAGAACQAEAVEQYGAVLGTWLAEAVKAKKGALRGGRRGTPPPAGTPVDLAAGIDSGVADRARVARAEIRAGRALGAKCGGVAVDPLFDCADAAADVGMLTACVITQAERAACEALETADGLDLTCP